MIRNTGVLVAITALVMPVQSHAANAQEYCASFQKFYAMGATQFKEIVGESLSERNKYFAATSSLHGFGKCRVMISSYSSFDSALLTCSRSLSGGPFSDASLSDFRLLYKWTESCLHSAGIVHQLYPNDFDKKLNNKREAEIEWDIGTERLYSHGTYVNYLKLLYDPKYPREIKLTLRRGRRK